MAETCRPLFLNAERRPDRGRNAGRLGGRPDRAMIPLRLPVLVLLAALASLAAVAACGPLPRPFERDNANPLLTANSGLLPVAVSPVAGAPGLAEGMAEALVAEDIAASIGSLGPPALTLRGRIDKSGPARIVRWQVAAPTGQILGEVSQPLPAAPVAERPRPGAAATSAVAQLLRGDDSGAADVAARPRVAVRPVVAPKDFDGGTLTRAMAAALERQGLAVDPDKPAFVVEGSLRIGPAGNGQDMVEVDWTVRDSAGKELGVVSQGSPVPHQQLLGAVGPLARDIANAGAEGIGEVIRKSHQSL